MSKRNTHEASPARRAQGLEPEITAQPRLIPDEIALEASAEPDLTIDVDDLGSRFLREATEQGDFDPERAWPSEASLFESPAGDEAQRSSTFVVGSRVWEQTVDLETRTQGAADLLRAPAPPLTAAEWEAALDEETMDIRTEEPTRNADSSVRELSLFDEQDGPPKEVVLDEQGSHTRKAARQNIGQRPPSPKANPQARAGRESPKGRAAGVLPAALRLCARALRALANRLQTRANAAGTPRVPNGHASPSQRDQDQRLERKLDEAIEMTFPASDPISI
ncbi:MAG TPA: hypothetical protein VFN67_17755 [Polyangiales bacterium]|nr:hypothetical protein [Polyangiales bacterium]